MLGARRRVPSATIAAMGHDDRFDDLIASLGGFHRSWLVYLGMELGLFARIREAGARGISTADLAAATGAATRRPSMPGRGPSDAHELVTLEDGRLTVDDDVAAILLDDQRGGVPRRPVRPRRGRLAWTGAAMVDFFRTGRPIADPAGPLSRRDRATDAPGHRGLLPGGPGGAAAARRRPVTRRPGRRRPLRRRALAGGDGAPLPGARARRRRVRGGLGRPRARERRGRRAWPTGSTSARQGDRARSKSASTTWPTSSTPCTSSPTRPVARRGLGGAASGRPDPRARLAAAVRAEEFRTRHGELIAGVQLDELFQGTALATAEQFLAWFAEAGLPAPERHRPAVRRVGRSSSRAPGLTRGRLDASVSLETVIVPVIVAMDLAVERIGPGRREHDGAGGSAATRFSVVTQATSVEGGGVRERCRCS